MVQIENILKLLEMIYKRDRTLIFYYNNNYNTREHSPAHIPHFSISHQIYLHASTQHV